jgi:hypothetical protein
LVEKFPQFDTPRIIEKLKQERDGLAVTLEERVRAGRYDLSKLPSDQRRAVADRFIVADDELRNLSERMDLLRTAEGLRTGWSEAIERDMIE